MSDASLGGVDQFGYPEDQDSKTVKVYSQAGIGIFIGEKSLAFWSARSKFNVLDCDSRTTTHECGVGFHVDSMQFYADLLSEIL